MLNAFWNTLVTSLRPYKLYIDPRIDFDEASGSLRITVGSRLNDRLIRISKEALRKGHGRIQASKFRIDQKEREEFLEAIAGCEWIDSWVLTCPKSNIPECLPKLRNLRASQTDAVKTIQIQQTPLEPRLYLELDDPDTLVVRQHLATSDGQVIPMPEVGASTSSGWLPVSDKFFKIPEQPLYRVQQGHKADTGSYRMKGDEIPEFIEKELPLARKAGRVFADKNAAEIRVVTNSPDLSTNIDLDESSREIVVRPQYRSGSTSLSHSELRKADRARSYVRKGNSFHRINWQQIDQVEGALKQSGLKEADNGTYRAPTLNLDEIINTFSKLGVLSETEVLGRFRERLFSFTGIDNIELPKSLKAEVKVRNYQQHGFEWLAFLKRYGLPGILADEMGLGKTLQTLMTVAREREPYGRHPSLVICPAGLVEKWADEAKKFLSDFETFSYVGQLKKRFLKQNASNLDLVIMSYETMSRDIDDLSGYQWRFLIVDEAQRIKNPGTQRAKAIRRLRAEARIAITGTPVENRLRDLWSIFDFLAPGYLFSEGEFERRIAAPIEQRADPRARDLLLRKTHPFILRRLKKNVATELPDKIEKTIRCELTETQRVLYQAVIKRDLEQAVHAMGGKKLSLGNPHIFSVLVKLKQICCHPGLFMKELHGFKRGVSGKFDAFLDLTEEIMESENGYDIPNKLLVFSQFVEMATYIQDYIISQKRTCARIDGSVSPSNRPALCREFNDNPSRFGMVLTLFSGGVGLDLQGANHVVLYDQWWNPAIHNQAIDRVHRIGQQRSVLVFYLITRGTLEEKIEEKLSKKKDIFDFAIKADELLKKEITREELIDLVRLEG